MFHVKHCKEMYCFEVKTFNRRCVLICTLLPFCCPLFVDTNGKCDIM